MEYKEAVQGLPSFLLHPHQVSEVKKIIEGAAQHYNNSKTILLDNIRNALYGRGQLRVWLTNLLMRSTLWCYSTQHSVVSGGSHQVTRDKPITTLDYIYITKSDIFRMSIGILGSIFTLMLALAIFFIINLHRRFETFLVRTNEIFEELSD
ncbi:hypothetical protein RF11_04016 [Thelohanellus kitauei]|uniref:Uncharacterized protein n=1 Tax=Thelohanellus kitauei TaxID=669202 RepID=A0A0C2JIR2_THEKT|nr:hypothetical protein RF11_04016 [Thelohanellus kitauei]